MKRVYRVALLLLVVLAVLTCGGCRFSRGTQITPAEFFERHGVPNAPDVPGTVLYSGRRTLTPTVLCDATEEEALAFVKDLFAVLKEDHDGYLGRSGDILVSKSMGTKNIREMIPADSVEECIVTEDGGFSCFLVFAQNNEERPIDWGTEEINNVLSSDTCIYMVYTSEPRTVGPEDDSAFKETVEYRFSIEFPVDLSRQYAILR